MANTRRAERLVRVERARLMVVEQDVLLQAVTVYTDLLAARAVLDFAEQNVERLTRQLQATRDRFEVGEVTRTDVAQADASLSGAISDRIEAQGAVAAAVAGYRRVVNQEPAGLVVPPPLSLLPASQDEAQQLAEDLNPNIAAAQYNWRRRAPTSTWPNRPSFPGSVLGENSPTHAILRRCWTGGAMLRSGPTSACRSIKEAVSIPACGRPSRPFASAATTSRTPCARCATR